ALLLLAVASPAPAAAGEPSADDILKLIDQAQSGYEDLASDVTMTVYEPGAKEGRVYKFHQITKGSTKRIVSFQAPGDVKGMGFLAEGPEVLHVYLPDMKRVRRMGTHITNQSIMGSDLTNEDLSAAVLSDSYSAKLVSADDKQWQIELQLKPGKKSDFVK